MPSNTSVLNIYDAIQSYNMTSQDYFVHMLRFSKFSSDVKNMNVLDIGCGQHSNLLKAACMMNHGPQFAHYIGIDYGTIKPWRQDNDLIACKTTLLPNMDMCIEAVVPVLKDVIAEKFNNAPYIITCYEVLEHMDFDSQLMFMYNLSTLMHETPCISCSFSTPNYNGSAAKNHISELEACLLQEIIEGSGLAVSDWLGLSSWQKYNKIENLPESVQTPEVRTVLDYLDNALPLPLSKMLWGALLDPTYSNNILWTLVPNKDKQPTLVSKDALQHAHKRQQS